MELIPGRRSAEQAASTNLGMNSCTNSLPPAGISAFPCSNFNSPSGTTTNNPSGSLGSVCTSTPCFWKSFRVSSNFDNTWLFVPLVCCKALLSMATSSRMKITASEVIKSVSELARPIFSCSFCIRAAPQPFERIGQLLQPFRHRVYVARDFAQRRIQRCKLVFHLFGFIGADLNLLDDLIELLRVACRPIFHFLHNRR